jgi:hypothetical protein
VIYSQDDRKAGELTAPASMTGAVNADRPEAAERVPVDKKSYVVLCDCVRFLRLLALCICVDAVVIM